MTSPDPRLTAAARLRASAASLGDMLAADALPPGDARAEAWRALCAHHTAAAELEAAARADAVARDAAGRRDLYGLLRLDTLFPRPSPPKTHGAPRHDAA